VQIVFPDDLSSQMTGLIGESSGTINIEPSQNPEFPQLRVK